MPFPHRRRNNHPSNTNPVLHPQPISHQNPSTNPRNPPLQISHPRMLRIQPKLLPLRLLRIPAHQLIGPRSLRPSRPLPDNQLQRIPPSIPANPVIFPRHMRPHQSRRSLPRNRLPHRQRRRIHFRRRINQHLRRRPPHRPDPKRPQRKSRFRRQRRHLVQPTPLRPERHFHSRSALRRHIAPGPLPTAMNRQPDAITRAASRVVQDHTEHSRRPGVLRLGWHEVHRKASQGPVAHMHADGHAPRQQESQQIAKVELIVDRRDQKQQQRRSQHPPRHCRHDVDIPLRQLERVRRRTTRHEPPVDTGTERRKGARDSDTSRRRLLHGSGTAASIARTCSTAPRPASPTGVSRCAMVCGRTAWTSSGAT